MARVPPSVIQSTPEAPADAAPPSAQCELHIWPAGELKGFTGGEPYELFYGGLIGALIERSEAEKIKRSAPSNDVLKTEHQLERMQALDLPALLRREKLRVIPHDQSIPRLAVAAAERHAPSQSTCYAELIVSQVFFDYTPMSKPALRSLIAYRDFEDAPTVRSSFTTWTTTPVTPISGKTGDTMKFSDMELGKAFDNDVRTFIAYSNAHGNKAQTNIRK